MDQHAEDAETNDLAEINEDETEGVLSALHALLERVSNPVIRTCLEDAVEDIEHLTVGPEA
jgi:hypothetical protein